MVRKIGVEESIGEVCFIVGRIIGDLLYCRGVWGKVFIGIR